VGEGRPQGARRRRGKGAAGLDEWQAAPFMRLMVAPGSGKTTSEAAAAAPAKPLSPAAKRALEEAAARRAERDRAQAEQVKETPSRGGLEPTRYGDWEVNGIASDF
jgi:hypothetical protein